MIQYHIKNSCIILIIWTGFKKQEVAPCIFEDENKTLSPFSQAEGSGQGLNRRETEEQFTMITTRSKRESNWREKLLKPGTVEVSSVEIIVLTYFHLY